MKTLISALLALLFLPVVAFGAAPTPTGLTGKDATPATQTLCTYTVTGSMQAGCQVKYVWNGATWLLEPVTVGGAPVVNTAITNAVLTPLTVSTTAYTSGFNVGGLITQAPCTYNAESGIVQEAVLQFNDAQNSAYDLVEFSSNPGSSTITDHAAYSLATADIGKVVRVIHLADCTSHGTPSTCQAAGIASPMSCGSGTSNVYWAIVARSTPTYGSTSDVSFRVNYQLAN